MVLEPMLPATGQIPMDLGLIADSSNRYLIIVV
jgi:hypothetical protein